MKKLIYYGFLTLTLSTYSVIASAAYPTQITYNVNNKSDVNLTGIPAHTQTPPTVLSFPADQTYAYSVTYGVENTDIQLCVGIGINNFSQPYVGAYALYYPPICTVTVTTIENNDTNYTVVVNNK